jgi:hypothetical protein
MIKHILGLKKGLRKDEFRLRQLYYDVPGRKGAGHMDEIDSFTEVAEADSVKFHSLAYQKLIVSMCKLCCGGHGRSQPPSLGWPIQSVAVKACAFGQSSNLTQSARAARRISGDFALRVSCLDAALPLD